MEGLRDEVEPLINDFDDCVGKHIEVLRGKERDQDDEIESWEMHMELLHYKWQKFTEIMSKRKSILDGVSEEAVVVADNGENGSVAEEGEGTPGAGSVVLDVTSGEHPPSSAADVKLSDAEPVATAPS